MERLVSALRRLRRPPFRAPPLPLPSSPGPGDGASSLYLQALEHAGDAVVITNRTGVIEYVNLAFEMISGYGRDEVVGQRPSLLKLGIHQAPFYSRLWDTLNQGNSFRGDFINRHRYGALFLEEQTISPIKAGNGRVTHYVSTGRKVNGRIAIEHRLHRLTHYDALTGLPNRKLFLSQLAAHIERSGAGHDGLLLLLDINNLEKINDTLGYDAGDRALCQIARRLETYGQTVCNIARLGGDEFASCPMATILGRQALPRRC